MNNQIKKGANKLKYLAIFIFGLILLYMSVASTIHYFRLDDKMSLFWKIFYLAINIIFYLVAIFCLWNGFKNLKNNSKNKQK